MKIYKIANLTFGTSSFVQQNVKPDDVKQNRLQSQPVKDTFEKESGKEEPTPQDTLKQEQERKLKEFEKLASSPQKYRV